jgi:hypothetical protein
MKTGRLNQAFRRCGRLTLTDQMSVNQRLIDSDATQGNTDDKK